MISGMTPLPLAHFDVDESIYPLLSGTKYSENLLEIPKGKKYTEEAISLHVDSAVNKETLSHLPNLKLILTRSVGIDHIDLDYCKERNIAVYHITDYGAIAIAEHALALILYGARHIGEGIQRVKEGDFDYKRLCGFSLSHKTAGIVGTGKIGLELIKLLKPFQMKILAYDVFHNDSAQLEHGFTYVSLDELLAQSDIVSLHAPYMKETHHMIGDKQLRLMKKGSILINTARGGLLESQSLVTHSKKFRFIGLDVLENEASFTKKDTLLSLPNVAITPHIAFYTDLTVKKIADETSANLNRFIKNDTLNRVI
jgi:D-lactate dehydrogenase